VVLTDDQRNAKRQLIEDNRERRKCSDIRLQLKKVDGELSDSMLNADEMDMLNTIAQAYCQQLEAKVWNVCAIARIKCVCRRKACVRRHCAAWPTNMRGKVWSLRSSHAHSASLTVCPDSIRYSAPSYSHVQYPTVQLLQADRTALINGSWLPLTLLVVCRELEHLTSADSDTAVVDTAARALPSALLKPLVPFIDGLSILRLDNSELALVAGECQHLRNVR
jgi:hypothetical protein